MSKRPAKGPIDAKGGKNTAPLRSSRGAASRTSGRTTGRTARAQTRSHSHVASDTAYATDGLTNARTRIVGSRTGLVADGVVTLVRMARIARDRLGRVSARLAAVVTPVGWALLVIVPFAFVAAAVVGWVELLAVGWAGLVLLAIAAVVLIPRARLEVELALVSLRVVAGEPATGKVTVAAGRHGQSAGATVEVPVGTQLVDVVLPALGRGQSVEHTFDVPTSRRGIVPVGPARSIRADPIGLVRRETQWTAVESLYVHPRTVAIPSMSSGLVRDLEGNPTRDLSTSDMSFHALREYQPGDERRAIHWKSTAKTGVHMVRQYEETRRSHLLIALSLAAADFGTDDEFEMAVSVAGSLGTRAIRDTRDVTVAVSAVTPEFSAKKVFEIQPVPTLSRTRLLDGLAAIDRSPTALSLVDVARVAADRVVGVSVAFLVCGSAVSSAQLRAAANQFPAGVETVAVVCDPEAVPGVRRLAGLTVFTIGFLEDLSGFLARSVAA
jgi:uncharacterized protein (DUF58 family)